VATNQSKIEFSTYLWFPHRSCC